MSKEVNNNPYWNDPGAAQRRVMYKAAGFADEDIRTRWHIGVANAFSEASPGTAHLRRVAEYVKNGIWAGGGMPLEFGIPSTCGNLSNGHEFLKYDLAMRDLVANSIELVAKIQHFDALVILASCDNIIAGAYLAAARMDIPTLIVPGGSMATGHCDGKRIVEADLDVAIHSGDIEKILQMEELVCPSVGACPSMGTANTMQILGEAMNLVIPGAGSVPAIDSAIYRKAMEAGQRMVEMAKEDRKPSEMITKDVLLNTIMADMAIAGSTNAVLHILAVANELGIDLTMDDFDALSGEIPCICGVMPSGPYTISDYYENGATPVLMKALEGVLHLDAPHLTKGTWGEYLSGINQARLEHNEVIHTLDNPLFHKPGLKVMKGNLSTGGAIVRPTGVPDSMMKFSGPAKVYDHEMQAHEALLNGEIQEGDVIVVRYEGCKGAPGMKEVMHITDALIGRGYGEKVALVTDARFSGFNHGAIVGHVSPEAYEGGLIALVENGDIINIDIEKGVLHLNISEEEEAKRRAAWVQPEPKDKKGAIRVYAKNCLPAHLGGAMQTW